MKLVKESNLEKLSNSKQRFTTYAVVKDRALTWPDGTVFYKYDPDSFPPGPEEEEESEDSERYIIVQAMQLIQEKTCVKFEPHTDQKNFVTFAHRPGRCASHVGMQGEEQVVALDLSYCPGLGQVAHELLHVLGFFHEHSRPDRDEYVDVLWDNIKPDANQSFWLKPETEADTLGEPYDYESVMHYPFDAFAVKEAEPTLLPKSVNVKRETLGKAYAEGFLTDTDITQINVLYTCGKQPS
ncbi:hypothetical protein V5799_025284 [Amblyomma americanum]|uniref:Metalloendopeptidase n=1 Tax=Amblyomma americanum TaxID=6943 RepID=A0AAQ4E9V3_AMBAM